MSNQNQAGVTRFELYLALSTVCLLILLVHLAAAPGSDNFLGIANRFILMLTLLVMQLLFLAFALWEKWRQSEKPRDAEPSDEPGRGGNWCFK